jgi:hypothetical protein
MSKGFCLLPKTFSVTYFLVSIKALVDNFEKNTRHLLTLIEKNFIGSGRDPLSEHYKLSRHFILAPQC